MLKYSKGFDNQKTTNNAYFELSKYIKHGQDKILQHYSLIKTALTKLSLSLPSEYQDTFTSIITDLITMKEKFKTYVDTINVNISSLYETCLSENSTNNSDTPSLTPIIKNSYDSISDEFDKLERVTKSIIQTKHNLCKKKQQRLLMLEQNLQSLVDRAKNTDFNVLVNDYKQIELKLTDKEYIGNVIKSCSNDIQKYKDIRVDNDNYSNSEGINILKGINDNDENKGGSIINLIETIFSRK